MPETLFSDQVQQDIAAWVAQQPAPSPLKAIAKAFKLKPAAVEPELHALAAAGKLVPWPDQGARKQRFWHVAPEQFVRDLLLAAARGKALTKTLLLRAAAGKPAHGLARDFAESSLAALLAEGRLRRYEKVKATGELYGPADQPHAWFAAAPEFLRGLAAELERPVPRTNLSATILAAVHAIEPRPSQLVSVRRLRLAPELADVSKRALDVALVAMWRGGKLWLSQHHDPAGLTEDDRFLMAQDEEGNNYVAVTVLAV